MLAAGRGTRPAHSTRRRPRSRACAPRPRRPACSVHQGQGVALNPPYSMEAMQCYIKYARAIKPRITQQVSASRSAATGRAGRGGAAGRRGCGVRGRGPQPGVRAGWVPPGMAAARPASGFTPPMLAPPCAPPAPLSCRRSASWCCPTSGCAAMMRRPALPLPTASRCEGAALFPLRAGRAGVSGCLAPAAPAHTRALAALPLHRRGPARGMPCPACSAAPHAPGSLALLPASPLLPCRCASWRRWSACLRRWRGCTCLRAWGATT